MKKHLTHVLIFLTKYNANQYPEKHYQLEWWKNPAQKYYYNCTNSQ